MKRFLFTICVMLLLTVPTFAAEEEAVRVAVIDSGVSTAAIAPRHLMEGNNYVFPHKGIGDRVGHGTAIASLIVGSDKAEIPGICPDAVLVPLVFYTKDAAGEEISGSAAQVAQAIYDAIDRYRCRIINLSFCSLSHYDVLRAAVDYAEEQGALIVASAGNWQEILPGAVCYPGGYDSVICVGAAHADGKIADFSLRGDTVDLLAQGTDLTAATRQGSQRTVEGTSYAAAIVTGAVARIWTENPQLTAEQVRERILSATRKVDGWQVLDPEQVLAKEQLDFVDVPANAWFAKPVRWALERGVTSGVTQTTFGPDQMCTQAHILTFLWKAAGGSRTDINNPYGHPAVQEEQYFYAPFLWAWEVGVVDNPALDPHAPCSRADVVTYLWWLAGRPAAETDVFKDVSEDAPHAQAVAWALEQGITGGMTKTTFGPEVICTRAQIMTFLYAALHDKT